jgi:hypothetical protein
VNGDLSYSRQPIVYASVKAEDTFTPPHFDYAQITVNVQDINDERPMLNMVRIFLITRSLTVTWTFFVE